MNRILHCIAAALCAVAVIPARADGDVFTSEDARKAMAHAIDVYLGPNPDLHTVVTYYVMPNGSTATTRRVSAMYTPAQQDPPGYLPPMLRFFPRLEASFDSIFALTNGRTPGALGSVIKGDGISTRVLRFSRNSHLQSTTPESVNPYDEPPVTPRTPEDSGDYEQTILVKREGKAVEVTHFYSTPPDSSFVSHEPLTELDREFSLLVTARKADVSNVSYNPEESMSGALYIRPTSETQTKGVKVTLQQVPDEAWRTLLGKVMSLVGSNRDISLYYLLSRPWSYKMYVRMFVVDYANHVIYAFYHENERLTAIRAVYEGTPFLPDDWYR